MAGTSLLILLLGIKPELILLLHCPAQRVQLSSIHPTIIAIREISSGFLCFAYQLSFPRTRTVTNLCRCYGWVVSIKRCDWVITIFLPFTRTVMCRFCLFQPLSLSSSLPTSESWNPSHSASCINKSHAYFVESMFFFHFPTWRTRAIEREKNPHKKGENAFAIWWSSGLWSKVDGWN